MMTTSSEKDNEITLKHAHKIEKMILKDFHQFCEENNIEYYLSAGTALGAIRHEGFIPWDDDIDVMMFREDYNKLCKVVYKLEKKYDFLSITTTENYFRPYAKLSLKNTKTNEHWERNTNFQLGIALDIFIIDFLPNNYIKKKLLLKHWQFNNKISVLLEMTTNDIYTTKNRKKIGRLIGKLLNFFHLNQKYLIKQHEKFSITNNNNVEGVIIVLETTKLIFPIKIFKPRKKAMFEGIELYVPNNYHIYLKNTYGDYMTLPPKEKQKTHQFNFEFGPY